VRSNSRDEPQTNPVRAKKQITEEKTMKTLQAVWVTALMVVTASPLQAEMASGDYSVAFNGNVNVWDLSGTTSQELGNILLDYSLNTDASGKLTGQGHFYFSDNDSGDQISGPLSFSGTVKSAGTVVRVNLNIKMNGEGQVQGAPATLKGTIKENLEVDELDRQLIGAASGKVSVAVVGLGRHTGSIPPIEVAAPIDPDMTGGWDLSVNLSTNRTAYSGTAAILLSNGRSFPLAANGSYAVKTDLSKLSLKGIELNRAITLSLTTSSTDGQMIVGKLSGKVLGQKLRFPTP